MYLLYCDGCKEQIMEKDRFEVLTVVGASEEQQHVHSWKCLLRLVYQKVDSNVLSD